MQLSEHPPDFLPWLFLGYFSGRISPVLHSLTSPSFSALRTGFLHSVFSLSSHLCAFAVFVHPASSFTSPDVPLEFGGCSAQVNLPPARGQDTHTHHLHSHIAYTHTHHIHITNTHTYIHLHIHIHTYTHHKHTHTTPAQTHHVHTSHTLTHITYTHHIHSHISIVTSHLHREPHQHTN